MGIMPCLQEQNADKDTYRHSTRKLPIVLSEMQTGNTYQSKRITYDSYQRARRTDAEPIIRNFINANYWLFAFELCKYVLLKKNQTANYSAVWLNEGVIFWY